MLGRRNSTGNGIKRARKSHMDGLREVHRTAPSGSARKILVQIAEHPLAVGRRQQTRGN
ncbi:MAG TPA: hypothetical protein PKW63_00155 [Vicinamibacterales bacterium]|jgi:hypothetical protein|nr:hypothetical protein [Vicinamibacterales bacterium]